ncbi:MAG: hypothetical protein D3918_10350 [Candidatus Electrothrix sp. AX2]|nr:hypothetical protein [Candidatus Electrothrix gigas]
MRFIPKCLLYKIDRTLILEDLAAKLNQANEEDKPRLLASIYLVLPEVPKDEPEWLSTFEKVSIAPAKNDVTYLTQVLSTALPATLIRTSSENGDFLPVTVKTDDPNALPISSFHLKRKHSNLRDQWYTDIANANGRMDNGVLDLPPQLTVAEVFAIGLEDAGIMVDKQFGPHESWLFIVASMNTSGTCGPYWFLVKKTKDLGQLKAQLEKAQQRIASKKIIQNINECISGINIFLKKQEGSGQDINWIDKIKSDIVDTSKKRASIMNKIEHSKENERTLPSSLAKKLTCCLQENKPYTKIYDALLHPEDDAFMDDGALKYWCRILAEGSQYLSEAAPLVSILAKKELAPAHTAARKALRRIDFHEFGPNLS